MTFKTFDIEKQNGNQRPGAKVQDAPKHCQTTVVVGPDTISATDLAALLDNQPESIQLLDVREPFEREICHIGGAHIPLSLWNDIVVNQTLQRDKPVVVYCKSGMRSAKASEYLSAAGFNDVKNLSGGIMAWAQAVDGSLAVY